MIPASSSLSPLHGMWLSIPHFLQGQWAPCFIGAEVQLDASVHISTWAHKMHSSLTDCADSFVSVCIYAMCRGYIWCKCVYFIRFFSVSYLLHLDIYLITLIFVGTDMTLNKQTSLSQFFLVCHIGICIANAERGTDACAHRYGLAVLLTAQP